MNDGLRISGTRFGIVLIDLALADEFMYGVERKIRINCARAKAHQCSEVVYVARLAGLQDDRDCRIHSCSYEVCFKCRNRKQRRDRNVFPVDSAVGQDQDGSALFVCLVSLLVEAFDRVFEARSLLVEHADVVGLEAL